MRTRQTKAQTRQTILDQTYEMYRDGRLDRSDVRLAAVLNELGYTTGAAYYIWPNQAAFRREFMIFLAENIEYATMRVLADRVAEVRANHPAFDETLLNGSDMYIDHFVRQEDFYMSLGLYEMVDPPDEVVTAVSLAYESMQGQVVAFFTESIARHDRRFVDESVYGVNELVISCTAMVEGFALRHRFQPEKITPSVPFRDGKHHLFSVNLLTLAEAFTEPI